MTLKSLILLVLAESLLSACSFMEPHAMDTDLAIQHETLAKHFQDEANELQTKIEEHKKFLSRFDSQRYVYGRHANDLKAHSQEVIDLYQQAVTANRDMAEMLREADH
ncbi:hypothetical protein QLH52_23755 [Methylomonas sp. OY6]|jgi:hypothetical protein|uniref:Uncharacterized protein n=1 Tax=Methylomonas defluvii TaxID=3045149 RepID=A0ABU4ULE1_9GAMM|nr:MULTISPECIES: hypothetical protein [unclassified Methylomonas]MDX8130327.1 hypothetical protein [Methylomonas sp. OY6]PKD40466.1 hypothetical protein CWO84_10005 [Methylomonas sp. Kb3]